MSIFPESSPRWTQEQGIALEAALEAINDVIAGYTEQISAEEARARPDERRITWLGKRIDQACDLADSLDVTDDANVQQVLREYSAIVRARDAAEISDITA